MHRNLTAPSPAASSSSLVPSPAVAVVVAKSDTPTTSSTAISEEDDAKLPSTYLDGRVTVATHWWGTDVTSLGAPFDVIVATDCIYEDGALESLVASFHALTAPEGIIYLGLETRLMMYDVTLSTHMGSMALLIMIVLLIVTSKSFGINYGFISVLN